MFNATGIYWKANEPVTIDNGYTLKLINNYGMYTLYCNNTFTNDGKVIIDNYGALGLNYTSINTGTIDIINGYLGLYGNAILNNTGTITLTDSSYIYIYSATLTNTDTIDISNITDLSEWYNNGTFKLEGGSTFILPKSITNKINTSNWKKPITLSGTKDNPVIFKTPYTITTPSNNITLSKMYNSLTDITTKT